MRELASSFLLTVAAAAVVISCSDEQWVSERHAERRCPMASTVRDVGRTGALSPCAADSTNAVTYGSWPGLR